MKTNQIFGIVIVLLLLLINWLTFHDFSESHTVRDWLTLLTSILIFIYFAKEVFQKS